MGIKRGVSLFIPDLDAATRVLDGFAAMARQKVEAVMKPFAYEIERMEKQHLSWGDGKDTGDLQRSIHSTFTGGLHEAFSATIAPGVDHAIFAEEDTVPHWPPIAALEGWARRHNTSAFLVARKIARVGTKGIHFVANTYNWALKEMPNRMVKLGRDIMLGLRW